jgi:hypothetical protein
MVITCEQLLKDDEKDPDFFQTHHHYLQFYTNPFHCTSIAIYPQIL